jgi:hypothetical protein
MTVFVAASLSSNLILLGFIAIAGFGFILGFFTSTGSGITNHPWEGHLAAPAARLPDEFHQFADRQIHDADLRAAHKRLSNEHGYDMTIDEVNARLAEESRVRKAAGASEPDAEHTTAT